VVITIALVCTNLSLYINWREMPNLSGEGECIEQGCGGPSHLTVAISGAVGRMVLV